MESQSRFHRLSSGFYVVPLNAWLQDTARDDHRARVISALNLMTSMSGIVAILIGVALKRMNLDASAEMLVFVPVLVVVAVALTRRVARLRTVSA